MRTITIISSVISDLLKNSIVLVRSIADRCDALNKTLLIFKLTLQFHNANNYFSVLEAINMMSDNCAIFNTPVYVRLSVLTVSDTPETSKDDI